MRLGEPAKLVGLLDRIAGDGLHGRLERRAFEEVARSLAVGEDRSIAPRGKVELGEAGSTSK
eukprot:10203012-Alexandrium_andersonii.AAC.1